MRGIIYIKNNDKLFVVENVITQAGMEWVAQRIGDSRSDPFKYIAIGSGTNPASSADTSLSNEIDRVLASISINQREITYTATFEDGTYDFAEFGIFDAAIGGTMLARYCSGQIIDTKPEYQKVEVTYKVFV